jgi:cytochrome c peroxidase
MKRSSVALIALLLTHLAFGQTTEEEWRAKALATYPDIGRKDSPLNVKFVALYNERQKSNPDFFKNPKWSLLLADEVAAPPASAPPKPAPDIPAPVIQNRRRGGPGRDGRGGFDNLASVSVPDTNPLTSDKVALGRQLFFGNKLSADHTVSCATCHDPNKAFADGRAIARGVNGLTGARNTPSLINAGSGQVFFWDGRAASLEAQVLAPIFNPKEMGLTEAALQRQTGLSSSEVADALASYVRTIRSGNSRYDWYLAGQTQVLTSIEKAGLEVFQGRGRCGRCHRGSNFTDDQFHNTGVGWQKGKFVDEGRFAVTGDSDDHGAFKTPTLREIARTAPYMHDGSIATLEDVVDFYSQGGRDNPELDRRMRPIHFTAEEKQALVAFLKTLSGQVSEGF